MVLISPALFGLIGALAVNALPHPAAAPQTSQAADPSQPWSYTCKADGSGYTDQLGNELPCSEGTICKEGANGSPCAWPVDAGGTANPAATTPSGATLPSTSASVAGSPLAAVDSSAQQSSTASAVEATSSAALTGAAGVPSASDSGSSGTSNSTASDTASDTASSVTSLASSNSSSTAGSEPTAPPISGTTGVTGASGGSGEMVTKTAGSAPVIYEAPDTSAVDSEQPSEDGPRLVAYYDNYVNFDGVSTSQLAGVTHLIMSFIDGQTMLSGQGQWLHSDLGNFGKDTVETLRKQKPGMKIMAAVGGWNNDKEIVAAADGGSIETFSTAAAGFVKQYGLDGLDVDWEFPKENQSQSFIDLCKSLKEAMGKDKILSVALGSKEEDGKAFTSEVFSALDGVVDMWNLMTYDYVNRYNTKTGHQSGGGVVKNTVERFQKQGLSDLKKVNIGFLLDAKYFTLEDGTCSASKPLDCTMGGRDYFESPSTDPKTAGQMVDNGLSGWLRYNPAVDPSLGGKASEMATKMRESFEGCPKDESTAFPDDKTHAWYDETNKVFWSWTTPEDNAGICEEWKSKVGGMFVWSLNQDENGVNGGPHLDAVASCVTGG
ncbi:hypothetical protein IAU59_000607 [Kwoniella sp. CBS 9459]